MQDSRREQESLRKLRLATEALNQLAHNKQRQAAWGQVSVKLIWEEGFLKAVEINDTTTIKDLPKEDVRSVGSKEQFI